MGAALFEKGREGFLDGSIDWDTDTIKACLLRLTTADTAVKTITAASNATPIVITATAHGFANGDLVLIDAVGGNLAANGIWKIANQAANTFELQRPDNTNAVGSAAYTSGGYAVCLGPSAAADFLDDLDGSRVGTDQTLGSKTVTAGVADAADITFPTVPSGAAIQGLGLYKDTGAAGTSRLIAINIGKQIATVSADAAASATTVWVEPLAAGIPNGAVLTFSNGAAATLTALAAAGARSLTVSALASAIAAGHRAMAPATGSGFPVTPNDNDIAVAFDNGANRIFKL